MKNKEIGSYFKMSDTELQQYINSIRNRSFAKKKGKGSYTRKQKHKGRED